MRAADTTHTAITPISRDNSKRKASIHDGDDDHDYDDELDDDGDDEDDDNDDDDEDKGDDDDDYVDDDEGNERGSGDGSQSRAVHLKGITKNDQDPLSMVHEWPNEAITPPSAMRKRSQEQDTSCTESRKKPKHRVSFADALEEEVDASTVQGLITQSANELELLSNRELQSEEAPTSTTELGTHTEAGAEKMGALDGDGEGKSRPSADIDAVAAPRDKFSRGPLVDFERVDGESVQVTVTLPPSYDHLDLNEAQGDLIAKGYVSGRLNLSRAKYRTLRAEQAKKISKGVVRFFVVSSKPNLMKETPFYAWVDDARASVQRILNENFG